MSTMNTEQMDIAGIDAMLADVAIEDVIAGADIDLSDIIVETDPAPADDASAVMIVSGDEAIIAEVLGELEGDEERAALYDAQESTSTLDVAAVDAAKPAKPTKPRKPAKVTAAPAPDAAAGDETPPDASSDFSAAPAATTTTRTPRMSLADLKDENFVLVLDDADRDLSVVRAEVMAAAPTAKKILEKFENLLVSVANGRTPSVYTMAGYAAIAAAGEITTTDLVKAFTPKWTIGTARSQAQQVIQLFTTLKVVIKTGSKLVLNDQSVIAAALKGLAPAA